MKRAMLLVMIVPLFISGRRAIAPPCKTCAAIMDTVILPADTARAILYKAIDTAFTPVLQRLDSAVKVLDSLQSVLDIVKQERGKKMVLHRVDTWRDHRGRLHTWRWWYWLFPNGDKRYYRTTKDIQ